MNAYWTSRSPRERLALAIGAYAILVAFVFLFVTEPVSRDRTRALAQLEGARDTHAEVEAIAARMLAIADRGRAARELPDGVTLIALLDETAASAGIDAAIKRIVPTGDARASVVLEAVAFDELVDWLAKIDNDYGITVSLLTANPTARSGRANVSVGLTL